MSDNDEAIVVQKQATRGDIIRDHIAGLGGYQIAEKYGLDTEKVKEIIAKADAEGMFVPDGAPANPDRDNTLAPLDEGVNPPVKVETTDTKTSTKNNP